MIQRFWYEPETRYLPHHQKLSATIAVTSAEPFLSGCDCLRVQSIACVVASSESASFSGTASKRYLPEDTTRAPWGKGMGTKELKPSV